MSIKPNIEVCLSPLLLPLYDIRDSIVVVIDILRATSTICVALEHGVEKVIPVSSIEECEAFKDKDFILAAERKGQIVEGFTSGNSPFEYMNGKTKGKTLVLTTTNGTRAIMDSKTAYKVVAGSFLNLDVLCEWLMDEKRNVLLLCAGWKNKVNLEDTLFAGAVTHCLKDNFEIDCDAAIAAEQLYVNAKDDLFDSLQEASHFKRLKGLGVLKDIKYCLTPNQAKVIPVLLDNELVPLR